MPLEFSGDCAAGSEPTCQMVPAFLVKERHVGGIGSLQSYRHRRASVAGGVGARQICAVRAQLQLAVVTLFGDVGWGCGGGDLSVSKLRGLAGHGRQNMQRCMGKGSGQPGQVRARGAACARLTQHHSPRSVSMPHANPSPTETDFHFQSSPPISVASAVLAALPDASVPSASPQQNSREEFRVMAHAVRGPTLTKSQP